MPAPLILTEGAPAITATLTHAECLFLNEFGIATVTPTSEHGVFAVEASRMVGSVALGDRQILVRPKIADLNRLYFLLGYAQNPRIWRDDSIALEPAAELLPAVAEAFARIATRAVELGLLHGYRTVAEHLPVLRGRILAGAQMSRLYGLPVPIAVEYDDFTSDIAENQLLAMATRRLLAVPRVSEPTRKRLQRLRYTLAGVSVPPKGSVKPSWRCSRLNRRYQSALRLAEIILAAKSFELHVGDLAVTGCLFDMWQIFEDFVTVAISEALARRDWRCRRQAQLYLDRRQDVGMRPDLQCSRAGGLQAVVDAKYKAERPQGFPNADLYQMLAYCTVLGIANGHLIYAKGNEPVRMHVVRNCDIAIHCHALDLALEPAGLLRQIDELADIISNPGSF